MRVFITGATGLLGRAIASHLREQGHQVVALVRPGSDSDFLRQIGVELTPGSLTDLHAASLTGCDAVVHAAGLISPTAKWEEYRRVNIEGTRTVLEAAARAGVRRALHVSSVSVYGSAAQLAGRQIDEDAPIDGPLPESNFYARSKREAEAVARSFHDDGRLEVAIVRPCFVYGEGDRLVVPRLVQLVTGAVGTTVGSGRNNLALVFAGNVAEGAVLALTAAAAPGRAYNLANDFPLTQRDLFRVAARALGRRRVLVPLPAALARLLVTKNSPIRARGLAFLALASPFVSDRARTELRWTPRTPHTVALPQAIHWHIAHAQTTDHRPS